jgi:hypothetical protein
LSPVLFLRPHFPTQTAKDTGGKTAGVTAAIWAGAEMRAVRILNNPMNSAKYNGQPAAF